MHRRTFADPDAPDGPTKEATVLPVAVSAFIKVIKQSNNNSPESEYGRSGEDEEE